MRLVSAAVRLETIGGHGFRRVAEVAGQRENEKNDDKSGEGHSIFKALNQ